MVNLRKYGREPYRIALIHGGPGAPGEMAPVAEELSTIGGVLEPLQTASIIEGQVQELSDILYKNAELPVILIGYSWGAWLNLIFTARYPLMVKKLILIASGPLEEKYASKIMETRLNRLKEEEKAGLLSLIERLIDPAIEDKNNVFKQFGKLISLADSFDPLPYKGDVIEYQYNIFKSISREAGELRKNGRLLELASKIRCPVVAIHGDHDPHTAEGVKAPLSRILKDFRFVLLKKCGHKPWIERNAKGEFYSILKRELS